jgi:hypothetical protein
MTAQPLASDIDTSTVAGHNLRALLLRLLDGDSLDGAGWPGWLEADRLGLLSGGRMTPLGREVAERLRPLPWRVIGEVLDDGSTYFDVLTDARGWRDERNIGCTDEADATRIAALLTADDLRAAKSYRVEP